MENDATKVLVSIKTSGGIIKVVTTSGALKLISFTGKLGGYAGNLATGLEAGLSVAKYNEGQISGERLTYKLTGNAMSMAAPWLYGMLLGSEAAPGVGTVIGITIGLTFEAGELLYDKGPKLYNFTINNISNYESGLRSGWHP